MSTLLIKNIRTLVSCDSADTVYENVDLYAENGFIKAIGASLDRKADKTIDASHMLCYPGLVNTHHHLYQVFSRNLPEVQNMELFDWLKTLYEIWKNLDAEVIRLSSLTGMGELMKHGCTTCFDHHYVFPKDTGDLLGAQFGAADELGIRMYASRGSMDLSVKDGGLPPDSVVQTVDEIMKDSERVIAQYHDRSFGAMHRVALAPCSPFSVSADLLRESAVLTCVRRRTKKTSCSRVRASVRSSTWSVSAGPATTSGSPTASTSTTRSCASSPRPARACATAPFPT